MEEVRSSSAWVATHSSHVSVDYSGIEKLVEQIKDSIPKVQWDYEGIHYFDNGPLTVQYLFVLDALNFCFWPDKDLNYDDLASGLKAAIQKDKSVFDADRLQTYTGPQLRELLNWPRPLPLEDERVRLLHEVGSELEKSFGGKACNLVELCGKSAAKLVSLIASHFPGFRDHTVYKGHQIFLYKRAQIFAADLWGAFKGQGYGEFSDIGSITIFADYIVPAVLQQLGVLRYNSDLASIIEASSEIGSGSEEEVELRACSVYAVEKIRDLIRKKTGKQNRNKPQNTQREASLLTIANSVDASEEFFMFTYLGKASGVECGIGSLVMVIWHPKSIPPTSSDALNILLSGNLAQ